MTNLYWHLGVTALISFGGLVGTLVAARIDAYSDVVMLIFFAGSVGAVVNNYYRLAKLTIADPETLSRLDSKVVALQMYVSILIAGILGFVMYGLCLSGLLQGALFPHFANADEDYESVKVFLETVAPLDNIDTAKAILWAFIAGFSERMIPNILDRFVAQAEAHGDNNHQHVAAPRDNRHP